MQLLGWFLKEDFHNSSCISHSSSNVAMAHIYFENTSHGLSLAKMCWVANGTQTGIQILFVDQFDVG